MSNILTKLSKPDEPAQPVRKAGHNTRKIVAQMAGVSEGTVAMVESIQRDGVPELQALARIGTIAVYTAYLVSGLPAHEQRAAAAGGKPGVKAAAKRVTQAMQSAKLAKAKLLDPVPAEIIALRAQVDYWKGRAERAEKALHAAAG
jgi:hypothetical protein